MENKEVLPLINLLEQVKPILRADEYEKYKQDPGRFMIDFRLCFGVRNAQNYADQKVLNEKLSKARQSELIKQGWKSPEEVAELIKKAHEEGYAEGENDAEMHYALGRG